MHGPGRAAAANAENEVAQHIVADQGMCHFRVKLHTDKRFFAVSDRSERRMGAYRRGLETFRQHLDPITVTHPYLVHHFTGRQPRKQAGGELDLELGLAELAFLRLLHAAAHLLHHELGAVADPQDRYAQLENPWSRNEERRDRRPSRDHRRERCRLVAVP